MGRGQVVEDGQVVQPGQVMQHGHVGEHRHVDAGIDDAAGDGHIIDGQPLRQAPTSKETGCAIVTAADVAVGGSRGQTAETGVGHRRRE